jgi:hypothetical protein
VKVNKFSAQYVYSDNFNQTTGLRTFESVVAPILSTADQKVFHCDSSRLFVPLRQRHVSDKNNNVRYSVSPTILVHILIKFTRAIHF